MAGEARALRAMPEDSPEEIAAKRKRFEVVCAERHRWNLRIAADLYIAAFLTPKTGGVPANRNMVTIPTTAHVWDALAGHPVYGPLVDRAQNLAGEARTFHWPLEFPDVVVVGGTRRMMTPFEHRPQRAPSLALSQSCAADAAERRRPSVGK